VFDSTQEGHDYRLLALLEHIRTAGNKEKCKFSVSTVKFVGHIVNKDGIKADPHKTSAILKMKSPKNISELCRFMGLANQLGKFSCHVADITHPLILPIHSGNYLVPNEFGCAGLIRKLPLTKPTILTLYRPGGEAKVTADVPSFGLDSPKSHQWVAASSTCISGPVSNWAEICSNWERGPGSHMGLHQAQWLPARKQIFNWVTLQATSSPVEYEASRLTTSSYLTFSHQVSQV